MIIKETTGLRRQGSPSSSLINGARSACSEPAWRPGAGCTVLMLLHAPSAGSDQKCYLAILSKSDTYHG